MAKRVGRYVFNTSIEFIVTFCIMGIIACLLIMVDILNIGKLLLIPLSIWGFISAISFEIDYRRHPEKYDWDDEEEKGFNGFNKAA